MKRKQLKRDAEAEALLRIEIAARSFEDFTAVVKWYDRLDTNRERRERDHEISRAHKNLDWLEGWDGEFLDIIFDSAEDMWQLIEDWDIAELVKNLTVKQKDVLYLTAVRLYTIAQVALVKGQTDRNIRKLRSLMIERIREKLFPHLLERIAKGFLITTTERKFIDSYQQGKG